MNIFNDQCKYRIHPDAAAEALGVELLLIHLQQGTTYRLNRTGRLIWDLVRSGLRADEVSQRLQTQFALSAEQADQDVRLLLADLLRHHLLEAFRESAA